MRIGIFNNRVPRSDQASGCRRLTEIIQILSQDHHVDLFSWEGRISREDEETYCVPLEDMGVCITFSRLGRFEKKLYTTEYDVVIFEFYSVAERFYPMVVQLQPQARIIVDSVDVHFARFQMEVSQGLMSREDFAREKDRELEIYRKAHLVIAVSDEDAQVLEKEGIAHTAVVTNIVPTAYRDFDRVRDPLAIFVGGFKHAPNVKAMKWFLDSVWPSVLRKVPSGEFNIVGAEMPSDLQTLVEDSVNAEYLGFLPSLDELFGSAAVSVAPLTYGGGVKGKVNEAMAHGIPLVTTHIGIQGIPAKQEVHCLVTDDPTEFAAHIVRLFESTEMQVELGKHAQCLAEETCSREVVSQQLRGILRGIGQRESSTRASHVGIMFLKLRYVGMVIQNFFLKVNNRLRMSFEKMC